MSVSKNGIATGAPPVPPVDAEPVDAEPVDVDSVDAEPLVALAPPVAPVVPEAPVATNSWLQPVQRSVTAPTTTTSEASFDMGPPRNELV
jgi:hypothetical protein